MQESLEEFNRSFKFFGQEPHPKIFEEFGIWISDRTEYPSQLSVDIAALSNNRNRYAEKFQRSSHDPKWVEMDKGKEGSIGYRWLGKLKNGLHVVLVRDNGGGSLTTLTIYVLRARLSEGFVDIRTIFALTGLDKGYSHDIRPYYRLVLEQVLQRPCPKCGEAGVDDIKLKENSVECILDKKVMWRLTFPKHISSN